MSNKQVILIALAATALSVSNIPLSAQERCYGDANKRFNDWRAVEGKKLDELSELCDKLGNECYKQKTNYNGMEMPIAAALIIEGERYGELADRKIVQTVDEAQDCVGNTQTVRGVYDFSREVLGITTILPEKATRIDFEELRKGNFAGGEKSVVRETGRTLDKIFNPFRW
ncbi:hypothetical protein [uncultured Roseibium sp.]|uniref:hypothetical protein n=1 Tax=uncultured Roseibium sp. TaxID=1936171 RepID=UPI002630665A|nr:hypothetical protein [uncultured Roseibium sp.]